MGQKKINTVMLNLEQAEGMVVCSFVGWREWDYQFMMGSCPA